MSSREVTPPGKDVARSLRGSKGSDPRSTVLGSRSAPRRRNLGISESGGLSLPLQGFGAESEHSTVGGSYARQPDLAFSRECPHPSPPQRRGCAFLPDSGSIWISGNFPGPGLRAFQPQPCIKGVHHAQRATEPRPQAAPCQLSLSSHSRPKRLLSPMASPALSTAPSNLRLLRVALLLLLLVAASRRSRWVPEPWGPRAGSGWDGRPAPTAPLNQRVSSSLGAPLVTELRCQCLQTLHGIHPKNIQSVNVKAPGPHCAQTEVIATLKNGQKACLNPASPMVKKIIGKMLNNGKSN
uniref:C-X-C motif chemokine n=2 Tax=Macaca fascicularis TaxID=9541 RepID=A0A7N9IBW6_MACFA